MIARLSKRMASFFARNNVIKSEDEEVYEYGLQLLLSTVFNGIIALILAIISGTVLQCICYLAAFVLLRKSAGGFHAKTHLGCCCILAIVLSLFITFVKFVPNEVYGNDSASRRNAAIQMCNDKYIEVYTVGFGSANDTILQNIADKTGGKYYKALNAQDIVDIFAKFGYMDDFDMTDTDGDKLPDAVETAGIRLQNGNIIYTNPVKSDTDGDGLLDGEEINPKPFYSAKEDNGWLGIKKLLGTNTVEGYYFKSYSDPRKKDSDGDGYDDNMETKKYKSCPLINEVSVHKLRSNYISIEYTGVENWKNSDGTTISYGGNQGWFFIDENEEWYSWLESDYLIQNYGCGLISPSDTLLYLALSDNQYST